MTTTTTARPTRKVTCFIAKPIHTRADFLVAQSELDALIDADPKESTPAFDRMELLAILIAAYEAEHLPKFNQPSPQKMVQSMAETKGVTPGQLAEVFGGRSRLSDFYNEKRPLSTSQIINIRELLGIPADLLISSTKRAAKKVRPR